jgi:hypothetical protein
MKGNQLHVISDEIFTNARIKYLPDDNGVYHPKSMTVFDRPIFKRDGWELSDLSDSGVKRSKTKSAQCNDEENRRKSFARAKNNLFDLLLCTPSLNCFVTLTFSPEEVNRQDYKEIVKRISVWLDNRVRRHGLLYVLVPEYHKDGESVHFHGLMNFEALNKVRAVNSKEGSKHFGEALFDDEGREIYNIADFPFGHTTVIPIDGENGREACAKYCYKYIIKSGGQKVGGRYYLSGGNLGRPRYEYLNIDIENVDGKEIDVGGYATMKRVNL